MSLLSPRPIWQELDGNGKPYAGGLLYTYEAGEGNTTPKVTYDKDGNIHSNPVVFDSEGRATIRLAAGNYHMIFTDGFGASVFAPGTVEGVTVWDNPNVGYADSLGTLEVVSNIAALKALSEGEVAMVLVEGYSLKEDGGGGLFYWDSSATASDGGVYVTPDTVVNGGKWVRQYSGNVSPRWWGAKGDGATDDYAAFVAARVFAASMAQAIELDYGIFNLLSDPLLSTNQVIFKKAALKWSGFNPIINPAIPISDTNRHFYYTAGADNPVFPALADIKNIWLDGSSSGWLQHTLALQSDFNTTTTNVLNLQTLTGTHTTEIGLLQTQSSTNALDITTLFSSTATLQTEIDVLSSTQSGVGTGTVTSDNFDGTLSGFASAPSAQCYYVLQKTNTVLIDNGGTWNNGTLIVTINGRPYSQAWVTSKAASLAFLVNQLKNDPEVITVTYQTITTDLMVFYPKGGKALAVSVNTSGLTGGSTLSFSQYTDKNVSLSFQRVYAAASGSDATMAFSAAEIPTLIRPTKDIDAPCLVYNNATLCNGSVKLSTVGNISFAVSSSGVPNYYGFTNTANKGFPDFTVNYPIITIV